MKKERKTFGLNNFSILLVVVGFLGVSSFLMLLGMFCGSFLFTICSWGILTGIPLGLVSRVNDKIIEIPPIVIGIMFSAPLSFLVRKISY